MEIVSDHGVTGSDVYWGDNPNWSEPHNQLTPSYLEQHRRYLTNGNATLKRRYDGPPPGTVVATAALRGARDSVAVAVTVPDRPSPRPDGRHFFYAVAHAGRPAFPARCWTGPLLTAPSPKG